MSSVAHGSRKTTVNTENFFLVTIVLFSSTHICSQSEKKSSKISPFGFYIISLLHDDYKKVSAIILTNYPGFNYLLNNLI
jgi:hypothetical protein